MSDLSLIPLDDLIKEIESRCNVFICAYEPNDFQKTKELQYYYGKGSWHTACALANVLNNDVLNNWNGELKFLQKLNDENKEV